ncbi:TPA: sugar transferase [Candidatus Falkowbacteria bacterium]|nr:MAG: sugar transferase [Candidatus Falkowbacteria bacterium GW2011_GWF2_43_32]HBA36728.1 sugar transferase [Candidatus Falkowbacteria bacterium]
MSHRFKKLILFAGDVAALSGALFLTLAIRYPQTAWNERWHSHWPSFSVIFLIWLIIFTINDLYNLDLRVNSRQFLRLTVNTAAVSSLLSILYFYLNVQSAIAPKTNLAIFIVVFLGLFFVWRGLYQLIRGAFIPQDNLAIIGFNQRTEELVAALKQRPAAGYQTALIFKNPTELTDLADSLKIKNIRAVVIVDDFGQSAILRQALFDCLAYKITFFSYPDFYELLTGKIPVEAIDADWFLKNLRSGQKNYFDFLKRLCDFFGALTIFLISLPFWPFLALAVKSSGRGPIFFRQTRLGQNEQEFKIIKFRTMRQENNDFTPTAENDPRITRFGYFLRRTRLDELPQVLNILKGEMSFIGPRPERPEIIKELEKKIPFYKTRLLIKPGLTGWDQISGRYHSASPEDSREKLQYDLFYLKQRSLYLDIAIALRTLATIAGGGGR